MIDRIPLPEQRRSRSLLMLSPLALAWQLVGKWVVVMGREKRGSDDDTKAMLRYATRCDCDVRAAWIGEGKKASSRLNEEDKRTTEFWPYWVKKLQVRQTQNSTTKF